MKKWVSLLLMFPFIFLLSGCTHLSKTKVITNSGFNNEIEANTHKQKIYYRVNKQEIKSVNAHDHGISIEIPRSTSKRNVTLSASPNLEQSVHVTIPASKPIINWKQFCNDYNDFQGLDPSTNSSNYKIPKEYQSITNGIGKIKFPGYYIKYNISNSKIVALRLAAYTADGYEDLGYYSMKEYKASLESAVAAFGNGEDSSLDDISSMVKNKYMYTNSHKGRFSGCHYRLFQFTGNIWFDVWK